MPQPVPLSVRQSLWRAALQGLPAPALAERFTLPLPGP